MVKYKDPLHIPSAQLVVSHNGKEILLLNKALLDQQNCWKNLDKLKALHEERLELEDMMHASNDPGFLILCDTLYTQIEFELQDAWGFPRNANFHRFWMRPKCTCPHIDNEDSYPFGFYVTVGNCPLHGK